MAHDFNLHAPAGANKKKKMLGRGQGTGRGTTAGKGHKGQQARSGGGNPYVGFEGGQMPLYRRLAHRGFSNYPFKKEWQIVNLYDIESRYEAGETVDLATLHKKGLIKGANPVKVLGMGEFAKKLSFKVAAVSSSAKEKIEKAGGDITLNPPLPRARPKVVKEKAKKTGGKK